MRHIWVDGERGEFSISSLLDLGVCEKLLIVVKCPSHKELQSLGRNISAQSGVTAVVCESKDRHFNKVGPAVYVFGDAKVSAFSGVPQYIVSSLVPVGKTHYYGGWGGEYV